MGKQLNPTLFLNDTFSGKKTKGHSVKCSDEGYDFIVRAAHLRGFSSVSEYMLSLAMNDAQKIIGDYMAVHSLINDDDFILEGESIEVKSSKNHPQFSRTVLH